MLGFGGEDPHAVGSAAASASGKSGRTAAEASPMAPRETRRVGLEQSVMRRGGGIPSTTTSSPSAPSTHRRHVLWQSSRRCWLGDWPPRPKATLSEIWWGFADVTYVWAASPRARTCQASISLACALDAVGFGEANSMSRQMVAAAAMLGMACREAAYALVAVASPRKPPRPPQSTPPRSRRSRNAVAACSESGPACGLMVRESVFKVLRKRMARVWEA